MSQPLPRGTNRDKLQQLSTWLGLPKAKSLGTFSLLILCKSLGGVDYLAVKVTMAAFTPGSAMALEFSGLPA